VPASARKGARGAGMTTIVAFGILLVNRAARA
jgi:hypothetical protein